MENAAGGKSSCKVPFSWACHKIAQNCLLMRAVGACQNIDPHNYVFHRSWLNPNTYCGCLMLQGSSMKVYVIPNYKFQALVLMIDG